MSGVASKEGGSARSAILFGHLKTWASAVESRVRRIKLYAKPDRDHRITCMNDGPFGRVVEGITYQTHQNCQLSSFKLPKHLSVAMGGGGKIP